jgi:hypothetical protein
MYTRDLFRLYVSHDPFLFTYYRFREGAAVCSSEGRNYGWGMTASGPVAQGIPSYGKRAATWIRGTNAFWYGPDYDHRGTDGSITVIVRYRYPSQVFCWDFKSGGYETYAGGFTGSAPSHFNTWYTADSAQIASGYTYAAPRNAPTSLTSTIWHTFVSTVEVSGGVSVLRSMADGDVLGTATAAKVPGSQSAMLLGRLTVEGGSYNNDMEEVMVLGRALSLQQMWQISMMSAKGMRNRSKLYTDYVPKGGALYYGQL